MAPGRDRPPSVDINPWAVDKPGQTRRPNAARRHTMRTRRSLLALVAVVALMASVALVASAASGKSKAKFSAESGILAVGPSHLLGIPGPDSTTDVVVNSKGSGDIKKITVHTMREGVLNDFPPFGDGTQLIDCKDNDVGGACAATATVLTGSQILSLHESTAKLTKIVVAPHPLFGFATYTGKLRGKLRGDFVITGSTGPVVGEAKLQIKGTATYACFSGDGATPLPDVSFCEGAGTGNLFLPMVLNVVDTGKFSAKPAPGAGLADAGHQLTEFKGKLRVTVNAAGGSVLPGSAIEITKAQAKYVSG